MFASPSKSAMGWKKVVEIFPSPTAMASSSSAAVPTVTLSKERIELNKSLHRAVIARDYELTKKLLEENGADAWWEEDEADSMGWSSLHYAADTGDEKITKLLLRRGAIWNAG